MTDFRNNMISRTLADRKAFSDPKGAIRKGAKMLPAVCFCGHKGKSQRPQFYQCTGCYYGAWAKSELKKAVKLDIKINRLRASAVEHQAKADAFRAKHGHDVKGK